MSKRLWLILATLIIAGGGQLVKAQPQQTQKLQGAKPLSEQAPPPPGYHPAASYTFKGTWYGFLTDSNDRRLGSRATPDQIKASVAAGAYYTITGFKVLPAEQAAPYAGHWVTLKGLLTSNVYSTGATAEPDLYGYGAGQACQGCPATKTRDIKILSIKMDTPPNDDSDQTPVTEDILKAIPTATDKTPTK